MSESDERVDLAWRYLRRMYTRWWARRVSTPERFAHEREQWTRALAHYSGRQIVDAAMVMRKNFHCPPSAQAFARLMDRRAGRPVDFVTGRKFDTPMHSELSKVSISELKNLLRD